MVYLPNVGKYTIHGSHGFVCSLAQFLMYPKAPLDPRKFLFRIRSDPFWRWKFWAEADPSEVCDQQKSPVGLGQKKGDEILPSFFVGIIVYKP